MSEIEKGSTKYKMFIDTILLDYGGVICPRRREALASLVELEYDGDREDLKATFDSHIDGYVTKIRL